MRKPHENLALESEKLLNPIRVFQPNRMLHQFYARPLIGVAPHLQKFSYDLNCYVPLECWPIMAEYYGMRARIAMSQKKVAAAAIEAGYAAHWARRYYEYHEALTNPHNNETL